MTLWLSVTSELAGSSRDLLANIQTPNTRNHQVSTAVSAEQGLVYDSVLTSLNDEKNILLIESNMKYQRLHLLSLSTGADIDPFALNTIDDLPFSKPSLNKQPAPASVRDSRQIDRSDSLLSGFNLKDGESEFPLHKPTGEKTRKTYDFTKTYHVGLSCHDIQATQGATRSGVYLIHPPNLAQGPWKVYCDLETEGGGWMVFQVRDDVEPHENFMRGWEDYKVGFGDFDREFWLGNILIWALTNVDNSTYYELAIDMEDWSGNRRFARYRSFRMGSERDAFRLYHQNLYYGNAGDSMYSHNGLPFSTFDVDNDNRDGDFAERSCARLYKGGWWYGNCHDANLNGWYLGGPHRSFADGINWYTWTGYNYSLKKTVMKLRPQINGPIDVGYGNYILTSPPDRAGRREDEADGTDSSPPENKESGATRSARQMANGKYDVSELLTLANTLSNPNNKKTKIEL